MIVLEHTVLSDDIAEKEFVCDLVKCKGACCSEGDYGAPLDTEELDVMAAALETVRPYMSAAGIKAVEKQGHYTTDPDGDFCTPLVDGNECAYAIKDPKSKQWKCTFELAWKDGKLDFRKPISCQLYPIRVTKKDHYHLLNYHRWYLCSPACDKGAALKVPIYQFLKEPLTRAYGAEWYAKLCDLIEKPANKA